MSAPTTGQVMAKVWETVQLLTGPNGLDANDHLARMEALDEAARLLAAARDGEAAAAVRGGWSYGDVGRTLGITRTAAHARYARLVTEEAVSA